MARSNIPMVINLRQNTNDTMIMGSVPLIFFKE